MNSISLDQEGSMDEPLGEPELTIYAVWSVPIKRIIVLYMWCEMLG